MASVSAPPVECKKPIRTFRDLKVWEKAFHLARDIHRLADRFTSSAPVGLPQGMREASITMTTQIAQGHTHSYLKDFLRCLDSSLAALSDLETRVLLAGSLDYLDARTCSDLASRIGEVRRMEWGLVNRLRARDTEA
ncbi:MAG: four helix bundle protein [Acidobacteriota bacterium]